MACSGPTVDDIVRRFWLWVKNDYHPRQAATYRVTLRLLRRLDGETTAQLQSCLTTTQKADLKAWRKTHRFHPCQLRHTAATLIRREFGLETAQLALGHASATITDAVYAERDAGKVMDVMRRVG